MGIWTGLGWPRIEIKSRRMRWAGHVARMGEERGLDGLGGETEGKETTG